VFPRAGFPALLAPQLVLLLACFNSLRVSVCAVTILTQKHDHRTRQTRVILNSKPRANRLYVLSRVGGQHTSFAAFSFLAASESVTCSLIQRFAAGRPACPSISG
jgi:hypothetical protein